MTVDKLLWNIYIIATTQSFILYLRLYDVRLSHVSDAKQQKQVPVTWTDDRPLAEHESLCSLLGSRQFGEDESSHERLRDDSEARLEHEEADGVRTAGTHAAEAVANRLLRLDREQQRRRKIIHLKYNYDLHLNMPV